MNETTFTKTLTNELNLIGIYGTVLETGIVVDPMTFCCVNKLYFRFPDGRTTNTGTIVSIEAIQDAVGMFGDEVISMIVNELKEWAHRVMPGLKSNGGPFVFKI